MSGPHVFCDFRCPWLVQEELMARVVPLRSTVVCIESIPAYAGVVVRGYLTLVYVWLSCRAVAVLTNLGVFFVFFGWRYCSSCCVYSSDFNSRGTRFTFGCSGVLRGAVCLRWRIALMPFPSLHSVLILRKEWSGTKAILSLWADASDGLRLFGATATYIV